MRILFIGDIVGRSGRTIVRQRVPDLVRAWKLDFVAANGENAMGIQLSLFETAEEKPWRSARPVLPRNPPPSSSES